MATILQASTLSNPLPVPSSSGKDSTSVIQVHELPSSSSSSSIYSDSSSISSDSDSDSESSPHASDLDLNATRLISSPYPDVTNQLSLQDLSLPNRLFALALTALHPVRDDYATAPYLEAFNWDEVFALLRRLSSRAGHGFAADRDEEFYVVIFRSKLAEGIDRARLGELDQRSHEEACASGGLLKYWFGSPDGERRNLATCLWRNHVDAVAGGKGPWHALARAAARTMYERIDFHVHRLVVERGVETWRLEKFVR